MQPRKSTFEAFMCFAALASLKSQGFSMKRQFTYMERLEGENFTAVLETSGVIIEEFKSDCDFVHVVIGREIETELGGKLRKSLRFSNYTGPLLHNIAVGELSNLDTVRLIKVALLKIKSEETFT
jgi:hypothetical protein